MAIFGARSINVLAQYRLLDIVVGWVDGLMGQILLNKVTATMIGLRSKKAIQQLICHSSVTIF